MDEPNILVKTALNEAVQKVNSGMSPTEALKKVAVELDLNPNYIHRTGEALNVALNYKHFKTASDRSTEFEIADIPAVVKDVFTFNDKTAAEKISEHFSVSDAHTDIFNYNRISSNPIYKRAYLEIAGATETHSSFPTTFNTVYEKANNYIQKLAKYHEEAQVAKVAAEVELNSQFSSLADEFKKDASYRTAFEEFESQVFSKYGEACVPYLDLLYKSAKLKEERGVHDKGYIMFTPCKEAQLFDSLMQAAGSFVATEKTASDAFENLTYEESFLKSCRKELGKAAKEEKGEKEERDEKEESSSEETEPEDPVLAQIKKKASAEYTEIGTTSSTDPVVARSLEKEALLGPGGFGFAGLISDLVHERVGEAFSANFNTHTKPTKKPNLTLDNMERKLLLQELMLTDPILSKVNPAKVVRAFEQLLRLSPEISKEKEVVRAELRAMVSSQALSRFDAEALAKTDIGMLKRRMSTQHFNTGNSEMFKL
jgi:hypothetical protein